MKTRFLILFFVFVIVSVGFFYYISVNGFSIYHSGIYIELLSDTKMERFDTDYKITTITKEELMQFPQIYTMVNLLLEEKKNPQGTRSFFVYFETFRIFDSHGELKIKNHMSDSGATNLYSDFTENFESNVIKYDGNYFSISRWIA